MSTPQATRATGDQVAVPTTLLPALRAAARTTLSSTCQDVIDLEGQERRLSAATVALEDALGTLNALDAPGVTLPADTLEPLVAFAIRLQEPVGAEFAMRHTAEAFDELERRAHIARRLRMLQHELTTRPAVTAGHRDSMSEDGDAAAWTLIAEASGRALALPGLSDECRSDLEEMVVACLQAAGLGEVA
jgi:hypothetical protein